MSLPLVSILIPSYKSKYFELTLKSAIAQSYGNIEIVISDDCPNDDIAEIVNRYMSVAPINYQRNPNPDGIGFTNLNACLNLARGEYIKFLFDDDVLMPFAVQYMVNAFTNHKAINPRLVVSERWFIDSNNHYTGTNKFNVEGVVKITDFAKIHFMAVTRSNLLGEFSTAMWRREDSFADDGSPLYSKINGHNIVSLVDVAMWINLAERGEVLYIALPLSCFRRHNESNTSMGGGVQRYKFFIEWEIIVDQALITNKISKDAALKSYSGLVVFYRGNEPNEPTLKGHADRLIDKITTMMND